RAGVAIPVVTDHFEPAAVVVLHDAGAGVAIAPGDDGREISGRGVGVGIGEGGDNRAAEVVPFGGGDVTAGDGDRVVVHRRRRRGRGRPTARAGDIGRNRLGAGVVVGVPAGHVESATDVRGDRAGAGGAVAPVNHGREISGAGRGVAVGEVGD